MAVAAALARRIRWLPNMVLLDRMVTAPVPSTAVPSRPLAASVQLLGFMTLVRNVLTLLSLTRGALVKLATSLIATRLFDAPTWRALRGGSG